MSPKPRYTDSPSWSDITPLPQDDGGPTALATIAYTDEYRECMSYLRAVMAANEHSKRVLLLTAHAIDLNPAHYTVWLYRAKTLQVLSSDIRAELEWLNATALKYIKNYQIWHHRQTLITLLAAQEPTSFHSIQPTNGPPVPTGTSKPSLIDAERTFLNAMLDKDAKNYHVWSYRQWLVRKFALWDTTSSNAPTSSLSASQDTTSHDATTSDEITDILYRLRADIRNNSAWNHRFFVVFGRYETHSSPSTETIEGPRGVVDEAVLDREVDFGKEAVRLAPQNESPWNYIRGVLRRGERGIGMLEEFAGEFVEGDNVRSSHALDVLADIYAEQKRWEEAEGVLELLAGRYDVIRAGYWRWRKGLLGKVGSGRLEVEA